MTVSKLSTPLFDSADNDHSKMLEDIFGNVSGRQQDSNFYNEAGGVVRKAVPEVGILDDIGKVVKFLVIAAVGIGAVYLGYSAYQTFKNPLGSLFGTNLTPQQALANDIKKLYPHNPNPGQNLLSQLFPSAATKNGVTVAHPNNPCPLQAEIAALFHALPKQTVSSQPFCPTQAEIAAFDTSNLPANSPPGLCCCFFNSIFGNCFVPNAGCPGPQCFTDLNGFCPYCNILQSSISQPQQNPACCFFQSLFYGGCPGGAPSPSGFQCPGCVPPCPGGFCPGACPGF